MKKGNNDIFSAGDNALALALWASLTCFQSIPKRQRHQTNFFCQHIFQIIID